MQKSFFYILQLQAFMAKIFWLVTLTDSNGLSQDIIANASNYFKKLSKAYVVLEKPKVNPHIHGICEFTQKHGSAIRRSILRNVYKYDKNDPKSKYLLRVERVKSIPASFNYLHKDKDRKVLCNVGYGNSYIQEQLELSVTRKNKFIEWKYIKVDQVPGLIKNYCDARDQGIFDREDFINVVCQLSKDGYNTRLWMKSLQWIFNIVSQMYGNDHELKRSLNMALLL